jgi:hypothetical protein
LEIGRGIGPRLGGLAGGGIPEDAFGVADCVADITRAKKIAGRAVALFFDDRVAKSSCGVVYVEPDKASGSFGDETAEPAKVCDYDFIEVFGSLDDFKRGWIGHCFGWLVGCF